MPRLILLVCSLLCSFTASYGQSLGTIQNNTNAALPSSYNFQEYVYAEPDDQGDCTGAGNVTAAIQDIFLSQTHRHAIGHPLFFTIGHRPALLQLAVTGSGVSPDVKVEGIRNGNSLGVLCMAGPETLQSAIDLEVPNFENYFSVTLPKLWMQDGLQLILTAGNESVTITSDELNIGPYTEMNLVLVNMDVMDYNGQEHQWPIFDRFLQEMASAIPASVVRFGIFPEKMTFPELIANNQTEQLVRLTSRNAMAPNGIFSDGSINSVATLFLGNLHRSTGDYLSTVYFGNTLNLAPGGWGGGKSFVGFDYTDIFIHELGHALSLPHWGQGSYGNPNPSAYDFLYPYGGEGDDGGGRGQSWNFIQDSYGFEDPTCRIESNDNFGEERSDCMQRNNACLGTRADGPAPWDGYGDFSALAIHRYLMGADVLTGQVLDRQEFKEFQFSMQSGFPIVSLDNGKRTYTRDALQPQSTTFEENFDLPGEEQIEQDVYLVYGSAHESQAQANIVYKPIKFKGTLPPVVDPTDPETFSELQGTTYLPYLYNPRDIVLKLTYEDGSVLHALNPFDSYVRAPYTWGYHIWRNDVCNFSLVVPGDKNLVKVELYKRPFCIREENDATAGNINYAPHNITAENFMAPSVFQAEYEFGQPQALGSNTIGNRVWHDLNQNGMDDQGEEGIPGVSLVLWRDSDGDNIPDWMGFGGVVKTDDQGYYSYSGLGPGNYLVFVWSVDNWEVGKPLHGMVPVEVYTYDPNSDINFDNNGRPGHLEWGLTNIDIVSGMITLTAEGEPLGDGDRQDDWFNFDPSGNMTVDFGFYVEGAVVRTEEPLQERIHLYPNPFTDQLTVDMPAFEGHVITIIDTYGREMFASELFASRSTLGITHLQPGAYVAMLRNKDGELKETRYLVRME